MIDTAQNSDMGLFGLALDGNSGRNHKLYVADMNGRILRLDTAAHPAAPEVFSQVPISSGLAGDWMKSMWNDLVFDKAGNLYVPDDKPRIWRVGPDGTASIWFTDPRLTGSSASPVDRSAAGSTRPASGCTSRSPCRSITRWRR